MKVLKKIDQIIKELQEKGLLSAKESAIIVQPVENQTSADKVSLFVAKRMSALLYSIAS